MSKPVVEGIRIAVESILEELGAGQAIEDLLEAHPRLTREGILAAVRFGDLVHHHDRPAGPGAAVGADSGQRPSGRGGAVAPLDPHDGPVGVV
ncbi:MAG: DUF433 domain-containing protein [Thermoleophilia bacterium]